MMMLLQCPRFFRSPSRNQTPSEIFCTVSGVALELDTKKASEASAANMDSIQKRKGFMFPKFTFNPGANATAGQAHLTGDSSLVLSSEIASGVVSNLISVSVPYL